MHLTKRVIDTFVYQGPMPRRDVSWDDLLPGFGVRLFPSGRKAFVLSYRHQGRKRLMTIGQYGVLTLDAARDRARAHLVSLVDGLDPLTERIRTAQGDTFKDLATLYLERYAKPHKKTWRQDEATLRDVLLPRWGSLKLAALPRTEVAALHRRIGLQYPYAANRMAELVSRMYELATQWGLLPEDHPNPGRRIQAFKETRRDRFVRTDEMPRLAAAIDAETSPYLRAAFWLYLLTGMRKEELMRARWGDIDFDAGLWRLPETKSGRVHHIPLSHRAIAILQGLPREEGNPHVIPGIRAGQPLKNIDRAWRRIRSRAALTDIRLHDLRRTTGSFLAQDGASLHLIGRILNHRDPSTTAVYAHFQRDHERAALDRHADRLLAAAYATPDKRVVALRTS
jgi:integrase